MPRFAFFIFISIIGSSCLAAGKLHAHGNYHDLLLLVNEEIPACPTVAAPLIKRAALHLEHEDWKACLADLEQADRLGQDAADTEYLRGRALMDAGMLEAALASLDRYIAVHEKEPYPWMQRGRVLFRRKLREAALTDFRKGMSLLSTQDPDHYIELAEMELAHHGEMAALSALDEGVEKTGPLLTLVVRAVELELQAGRVDAALARIQAQLNRQPGMKMLWLQKHAECLQRAGLADKAADVWRTMLENINAMPALERRSHAMTELSSTARAALADLTDSSSAAAVLQPPSLSSTHNPQHTSR